LASNVKLAYGPEKNFVLGILSNTFASADKVENDFEKVYKLRKEKQFHSGFGGEDIKAISEASDIPHCKQKRFKFIREKKD